MSVVPMQKVRLFVHSEDVDAALDVIQKAKALEFEATKMEKLSSMEVKFPHEELQPRLQHGIRFLRPYAKPVGLWQKLREGTRTELTEAEIINRLKDTDAVSAVIDDIEALQVEFADKNEEVRVLEEKHQLLADWKDLPIRLADLKTKYTQTLLLCGHSVTNQHTLKEQIEEICQKTDTSKVITELSFKCLALTLGQDRISSEFKEQLEEYDIEIITPPEGKETPDVAFVAVSEALAKAKGELALLYDQAEHMAQTHLESLEVVGEILEWQKQRFSAVDEASSTKYTVVFDGWLNQTRRAQIEKEFAEQKIAAAFTELEPATDEEPPVEIENSSLVKPFEAVTRLYGMPGHKDLDPTIFLAGFFFLFFGLSLTDVGYGLFLMIVSGIVITLFKVKAATKMFAKLLFFVGLATVLVGMAFGGYLGFDPSFLPAPFQALQLFDPIGNPLPVFYLALGLGVFQVMVGMVLKIYSEYKNRRLMDGVMDQGPWLLIFCLGILYLAVSVGYVDGLSTATIVNLLYVALVLLIISSGRHGETILGRIQSVAGSLYGSIGYFSDILSYSRLLALGLATTALAFAVNMIAEMVVGTPYVGYILAGMILIIGHMFTLAVNTLGAFIHSARLQFVEFFGKFIAGTGREFTPLARSENHIAIKDD